MQPASEASKASPSSSDRPTYPFICQMFSEVTKARKACDYPTICFHQNISIIRSGEWFIFEAESRHNEICAQKTSVFLSHLNFKICDVLSWLYMRIATKDWTRCRKIYVDYQYLNYANPCINAIHPRHPFNLFFLRMKSYRKISSIS